LRPRSEKGENGFTSSIASLTGKIISLVSVRGKRKSGGFVKGKGNRRGGKGGDACQSPSSNLSKKKKRGIERVGRRKSDTS